MASTLDFQDMAAILREGANRIKENHELLSHLDSVTGDGDHGTTMRKVAEAMLDSINSCESAAIQPLLETLGWNVMSVDGGSASPLLGSFFMGMSENVAADSLDGAALATVFEAGLAKFRAQTPAAVGDKTMLDALAPAVEAIRTNAGQGLPVEEILAKAADAAQQGAESTKTLQAKFGRARNLGARSIGSVDPGATSISLLFAGFHDALAANK
jgi:dihydroxyacetone kinase-like protein